MAGRRFTVLVAQGRDGDWAAGALQALGCTVVRGSNEDKLASHLGATSSRDR